MAAIAIKPEYGPTLGRLLAPRWRSASTLWRSVVASAGVALVALLAAAALTLANPTFAHGGRVPFSFSYRGLYRVSADPGGYVKVQRHRPDGRLIDSFAVEPLRLPAYTGELSSELPLYATRYVRALSGHYTRFTFRGEGKMSVNSVLGYEVFYTATVQGQRMFGRDILLLPERRGAREGVDIVMLTAAKANSRVDTPLEVASRGVLGAALKSFTLN
jgi:hypothetical protein